MSLLEAVRKERGLSRSELAAKAGISGDYVSKLEAGRRNYPNVQIAQNIARALGVRVEDLWPAGDPVVLDNEPAPADVR